MTLRKSLISLAAPLVLLLAMLGLACSQSTPTPPPTSEPEPTAMPTTTLSPTPTAEPAPTPTPTPTPEPRFGPEYWNPPTDYYGKPVYGGTLRINYEDPLEHANVWGAASGATDMYRVPTGATLLMENPYDADGPVIPDLAESWKIQDSFDGVIFHFREGTTWHNGDPFVCEDTRFSFETMITEEGLTFSYMKRRLAHLVLEEMACLDDMTLAINFNDPTAIPLRSLSNRRALVFSKAWFLEGGEEAMFQDVTMGIGPFKWSEGQTVGVDEQRFERNPDYFIPELPYLDELVIYGILDEAAQLATQLAHQTDWHWVRNWSQYDEYVDHDQIVTAIRPNRTSFRLWINARRAPFDNPRIRQAIVMAIDRQELIQRLQDGYAVSGGHGYPPGSRWELPLEQRCSIPGWCAPADWKSARAEAWKILREEGFDFEKTYSFTAESDERVQRHVLILINQLRYLGIKVEMDRIETIPYRPGRERGWGHFMTGWFTIPADDPSAGPARLLRCDSPSNYWTPDGPCDLEIQELLDQAEVEVNPSRRLQLSYQIELAAMQQYSSFPLYWEQEAAAFWPEVRGYVHFPYHNGSFRKFMHTWIDLQYAEAEGYSGQTTGVPGSVTTPDPPAPTGYSRPSWAPTFSGSASTGAPTPDFWSTAPDIQKPDRDGVASELQREGGIIVNFEDDVRKIAAFILAMTETERASLAREAHLLNQQLRSNMKTSPWREVTFVWLDLLEAASNWEMSFLLHYYLAAHRVEAPFYAYTPAYLPRGFRLSGSFITLHGLNLFQNYRASGHEELEGLDRIEHIFIDQFDLRQGKKIPERRLAAAVGEDLIDQATPLELEKGPGRYWIVPARDNSDGQRIHVSWEDSDTNTLVHVDSGVPLEETLQVIRSLR